MRAPLGELPRVLTPPIARRLGLTESAVRHRVATLGWQRPAQGVVLTSSQPPTRNDWILIGMALAGPTAALSGWDAARTVGLGPPAPPTPRALVLTRVGNQRRLPGVLVRPTKRPFGRTRLPGEHPTLPYIDVAHPARAVADTALTYRRFDPVRALVTSAVQRGLCTPDELAGELVSGPRGYSHWFRRSLEDVLDGARSIAEARAVDRLRPAGVPRFEVNVPIIDPGGRVLAVVDLLWRGLRAVLEIDSREFHFSEADWKATMRRHNLLTRWGFAVRHDPPADIAGHAWPADVRAWLRARARELGVVYAAGDGPTRHASGPPPVLLG